MPPLHKPLKIYPSLSDLRQWPLPPFAPHRAQEFPTLPPKPPKTLSEAEKEKEFSAIQAKVDKLAYSRKNEIDPNDYEYFKMGIKTLTKQERTIFELYLSGKSAPEILEITGIKERTLKFHNGNIYEKLGVHSRKQMLRYAMFYQNENGGII